MEHATYLSTCLPLHKFEAEGDTSHGDVWDFASLLRPVGCDKVDLLQL